LDVARELQPDVLRIPGGTVANYWDWKRGGLLLDSKGLEEAPKILQRRGVAQYDSAKTENFLALFEATGADGMLVVNMLTSNLQVQIEFIKHALKIGLPIRYVELGNEFYLQDRNYVHEFPSADAYAEKAASWAEAIKGEFPDLKIGIQGVSLRLLQMKREPRFLEWNSASISKSLPWADALTLHEYHRAAGVGQRQGAAASNNEFHQLFGNALLDNRELLDERTENAFPHGKELWITEYNLFTNQQSASLAGSWFQGLYAATMLATFLREPSVSIACNHVLVGDSRFGALYADRGVTGSNSFASSQNHGKRGQERQGSATGKPYALSATGQSLALFSRAAKNKRQVSQLHFTKGSETVLPETLVGWMFKKDPKETDALILNLSNQAIVLAKSDLFPSGLVEYEQLSGEPGLLIKADAQPSESHGPVQTMIELPPYSMTRMYVR